MANQGALMQMLIQQAQNNPEIMNDPNRRQILQVLMSGNAQMGQQLANQLLQQNGMTKEQGLQMARQKFGF